MFFLKLKPKPEILPPPPPFPTLELEEEPIVFDEAMPKEAETLPSDEFKGLFKEMDGEFSQKKSKKRVSIKKEKVKQKISKKDLKKIKGKKVPKKSAELLELEEDLGIDKFDFGLPKGMQTKEYIEFPETLEEFEMPNTKKKLKEEKTKPKEILEAEAEIESAIKKIKDQESPSFLKRVFSKKKIEQKLIEEKPIEQLMPELLEGDIMPIIQNKIKNAREALANFDLETAKQNYLEIMKIYNKLKPEEQAKLYHDIRDLYFERKSAEELKVI